MRSLSFNKFVDDQILRGGALNRVEIPLESIDWLHTIHFINKKETIYGGLGADTDEKTAYIKAIVEFVERQVYLERGAAEGFTSTNGIAGHYSTWQSYFAAKSELLERDSFLLHWYSKTPFLNIQNTDINVLSTSNELESMGIETKFSKTYLGFQETYICFLINKKSGGFAIGLSSGKPFRQNLVKCFSEAIINYFLGHEGSPPEKLISDFKREGLTSLKSHRTFWMHLNSYPEWLNQQKIPCIDNSSTIKPVVQNIFKETRGPIKIVGLKLSEIFSLHLGLPTEENIQLLYRRLRHAINIKNFDAIPHPIP